MSEDIAWHDAVPAGELWEGDILDVEVAGEQVLLVHLAGGEIRAYQGICPHQQVLLADGKWDEESGRLECAGHNWEFDLRTGAGVNPAGCRLYQYPVRADGQTVQVGIPADGRSHYNRFTAAEAGKEA
jgi:toluene monooxygenase system ferredoxin subunit